MRIIKPQYITKDIHGLCDKTQIYEIGTSPLGTGGLVNLGVVKLDLVSDSDRHEPVDYYVYRSENPLTGNWTVIV